MPKRILSPVARLSQAGDICVLIESDDQGETQTLRQRQQELIARYGGRIVEPVHLTCQRLEAKNARSITRLGQRVAKGLADFEPFPLTAFALMPLYSEFRQIYILKWAIHRTAALERLSTIVENAVNADGTASLYPAGWVSLLVTALEDIRPLAVTDHTEQLLAPYPLFTPGVVSISLLKGSNGSAFEFELLERFAIQ